MGEEIAISLKNISKCYKRYARPVDRLKEILLPSKSYAQEFWALRDINIEVPKGETLGIIGQNGSGKSTLLQIIAGTLTPTTGEVFVNGRISALLELGSGFNPEFTGRQNVFFNGQILGLNKEQIEAKFDDIAAFADIGDFIDQPVKTYSSGMFVRLAFAVAVNVEPDILIVDEALAVGDIKFQFNCFLKFKEFQEKGITILFVSHDSNSIKRYCNYAVIMNNGRIIYQNKPNEVVNYYTNLLFANETVKTNEELTTKEERNLNPPTSLTVGGNLEYRYGDARGEISKFSIENSEGVCTQTFISCEKIKVQLEIITKEFIEFPVFAMTLKDSRGEDIYVTNTYTQNLDVPNLPANSLVKVSFEQSINVCPGDYFISLGFVSLSQGNITPIDRRYDAVQIKVLSLNNDHSSGIVNLQSKIHFEIQ
ncbi:ABC transporter ATP-binding protein [Nostoc piscinale CENA21]|uniref:ABC transporter ATP-binding protein n=1 Tax=Nostoc piscinale CENA21 TaxID=224013 RepID=A0A0M4T4B8_9NOSO|nr:ABC transporter ATP-binding protein [Nostoc piscinale]ALF53616.1 ABC transporter ATP-binding protein [Nostoc piscinale CENA21]